MNRDFDFEGANRLCASHKQILNTIQKTIASRSKDADKFRKAAKQVQDSKVILSQIETALTSGNINVAEQPNEKALLHAAYVCERGDKTVALLKGIDQDSVRKNIDALKSVSSPLKWLFSSKQAKLEANRAYKWLAEKMQGDYPQAVKGLEEVSRELDTISVNEAFGKVSGNEAQYIPLLGKYIPDMIREKKLPADIGKKAKKVTDTVAYYQMAQNSQKTKGQMAETAVKQAINPLIMERTLTELRNYDIDVLSQKRSGIRVKALRDRGYRNMADIYAASQYQLASVYGISADSAAQIKGVAREIAQEVSKTIKLKISSDERTPAATGLLKAAYKYERIQKADRAFTPEMKHRLEEAAKCTSYLSTLNNNLCWVFSNKKQREQYVKAYQLIEAGIAPAMESAIVSFWQVTQQDGQISDNQIWADFEKRSIEYFNLLEDLCPGVFGNDDLLYGLPEELAREIQDQTFFPDGLKVTLRRYQEWGVKYILHQGRVLLGDEMGLGKTVQAIATMVSLRNTGAKKFLVVCPASVLPNWCKEIDKKSEFRSIEVHGYGRQGAFDSWNRNGGIAVTTYETLGALKIPAGLEYDMLVVDEAHFIKNENAQRSQFVRLYGSYAKRLLYMTGTALENKVEEMLSLLHVLNPRVASQAESIAYMSTAPQFRQMIAPVYYRRKREDVLTELPDITNSTEWCDLLPQEREAYRRAVLAKDRSAIRKVSWVTQDLSQSSKARRLKEIVEEAASDGRKILVFSFFLETIDRVIELLGRRCTQPINGSVNVNRRQEIIDEFENMPAGSVLPAQIQAGGTGLNIQAASVVVICEPQLKPSIENQAISRAYRMGQSRKVLVYRLLASDTIDERIDDMLTEKQAIFDAFADISEAVNATQKEEQQIDDKTFGKLIQEEIDRINAENGNPASQSERPSKQPTPQKPQAPASKPAYTEKPKQTPSPQPKPATSSGYDQRLQQMFSSLRDKKYESMMNAPVTPAEAQKRTTPSAYKEKPMVGSSYGGTTGKANTSAYKAQPMITKQTEPKTPQGIPDIGVYRVRPITNSPPPLNVSTAREEPFRSAVGSQSTIRNFTQLEELMSFARNNGIEVKDNREKGGCVWVKADPRLDGIIKNQIFGDRKFKYSEKSKALGGQPGWYY